MDRRTFLVVSGGGAMMGLNQHKDSKENDFDCFVDLVSSKKKVFDCFVKLVDPFVFIITKNEYLLEKSKFPVYFIPMKLYNFVKNYIIKHKDDLDGLMVSGSNAGTIVYWEENYHRKIMDELYDLLKEEYKHSQISTALSALGY